MYTWDEIQCEEAFEEEYNFKDELEAEMNDIYTQYSQAVALLNLLETLSQPL